MGDTGRKHEYKNAKHFLSFKMEWCGFKKKTKTASNASHALLHQCLSSFGSACGVSVRSLTDYKYPFVKAISRQLIPCPTEAIYFNSDHTKRSARIITDHELNHC